MIQAPRWHTAARRIIVATLSLALAAAPALVIPSLAYATSSAELQAQLDAAEADLSSLQYVLDQASAELGKTNYELDQTKTTIADLEVQIQSTQAELIVAREHLAEVVESSYKQGGEPGLVDLIMDSTSFEDLLSRIYYANKVSASKQEAIQAVTDLQASLEEDQTSLETRQVELEELLVVQEQQQAEAVAAAEAQAAYVGQLSSELVAAMEAERAAAAEASRIAAEQAAAEEAARQAAAEEQSQGQGETSSSDDSWSSDGGSSDSGSSDSGSSGSGSTDAYYEDSGSSSGGSSYTPSYATGDQRTTAVNAALSQVGCAYLWGEQIPGVGFDCNGLTNWAWAQAGVSIPYSSGHYSYGQFQWMKESGRWVTSVSQLQMGDLVFFSYDGGATCYHVAMYVGGGQIVHAISYSQGIQVTPLDWCDGFCGGGSPI